MLDAKKYIAIAVDIDGEVNLVTATGEIERLFPPGTVFGMSTIAEAKNEEPVSWLFYFGPRGNVDFKVRNLHLDYLENAD